MITVCGADCTKCPAYQDTCDGCQKIQGKVSWAALVGTDTCPIYKCVVSDKKLSHCGKCGQLPCNLYYDLKDPQLSEEEHLAGIKMRVDCLKEQK
jgi:hypothetical protein